MSFEDSVNFIVGFAGGSFLTEILTKSYPKFGSIVVGLIFGLMFYELTKDSSHKHNKKKK